jgi:ankyrin repeat protein
VNVALAVIDPFSARDADRGRYVKEVVAMATRSIPARPSLEFDRKQARALLEAARRADPDAMARLRAHHPRFGARCGARFLAHFRSPDARIPDVALHDAQLVIAREYGFPSWPRWKHFVESRQLAVSERAAELVRAVCRGDMRRASTLLAAEPTLESFDVYTACACGAAEHLERLLVKDGSLAMRKGGPLDREPILYACFSRFTRSDPRRAAGIVRVVRLLLEHGADANAHHILREGDAAWTQTCLYGAAGIANDPTLTRLLLHAGADVNELQGPPEGEIRAVGYGTEALYHASEFSDLACLRMLFEASPPPHPGRVSYALARMLDFENPGGVELFLRHGADPNFRIPWMHHRTHLHRAIVYGRSLPIVAMLVDAGGDANATDDLTMTPLRYAVRHGRDDVVALLQRAGAVVAVVTAEDRASGAVARGEASAGSAGAVDPDVLCNAAARNDAGLIRRLLATGADPNARGDVDDTAPLDWACWRGQYEAARALVEGCADLHAINRYGSDALGTVVHGSINCQDPLGGPGTKLPEEITHGDYAGLAEMLIAAGARLPAHVGGSEAVQEVLRRHGVPDVDQADGE